VGGQGKVKMNKISSFGKLERILEKANQEETLLREEITFLLELRDTRQIEALFKTARNLRCRHFGEKIFLYGFLYISTYCRNNCEFCFFRRSNTLCPRYRKEGPEILEAAIKLAASGVHLIDLTMGEDPKYFKEGARGFEKLIEFVTSVKKATGLPIMVSPGVVPDEVLSELARNGAIWYACYQETHQRDLFHQLRTGQSYDERMRKKLLAHDLGLLIEEGILRGIGESTQDVAESIGVMDFIDADQVRVMNFKPQKGTPMENRISPDPLWESMIIAVMRLPFPDRLIPASLDVGGLARLRQKLEAGANVVTSLIPPGQGLAGVAESSLDIEDAKRTSASVLQVLESCGLKADSVEGYRSWIEHRCNQINRSDYNKRFAC